MKKTRFLTIMLAFLLCVTALALIACGERNSVCTTPISTTPPIVPPSQPPEDPVRSWTWAIDETTGERLIKNEYDSDGRLLFKRYYTFAKTYNDEYTFAILEEVAYEEYHYEKSDTDNRDSRYKKGQMTGYEFYSHDYEALDYMPMRLQYFGSCHYSEDGIYDISIETLYGSTRCEDIYYYNEDVVLEKIEKIEEGGLDYTITYENGRPSSFIKGEEVSVPTYDSDGNMTSLSNGQNGISVEYKDEMPSKITLKENEETVTLEFVFDENYRLATSRLIINGTSYSANFSYNDEAREENTFGYRTESGKDRVEVFTQTKKYDEKGSLIYQSYRTTDGETEGKWAQTDLEWEVDYYGSVRAIKLHRTSSEDKNGGTVGEFKIWHDMLEKEDITYDDGTKRSFEYHYTKNVNLGMIVDLVSGDKYDFDVDEYGNVLSYTAPGEYYEYVKNLDVVYHFDRTRFQYFDKEAYVTKKVVDGWGTLKCYYNGFTKTSEKFESANRQIGYITEYYSNGSLKKHEYWEYMRKDGVISDKYRLLEQYNSKGRLYFRSVTDLYTVKKEYFEDVYGEPVRDYTLIYDREGTLQEKIEFKDGLESRHLYYDSDGTVDYGKSQFYSYTFFGDGRIKYKKTSMSNETVLQEDHYKIEINNLGEESYYLCESKVYDFRGGYMLYEYKLFDNGKTYKSREMSYSFGNVIYDKYFDENGNEIN